MTESHVNPDLMLDALHAGAVLSAADESHLIGCSDCRAEWRLLRATARLGATHLQPFDAGRVAGGVRTRLAAPRRPVRQILGWPVALAAAAALLLAVWTLRPGTSNSVPEVPLVLHELDSLNVAQLELVLAGTPPESGQAGHAELLPLDELTSADLERVLRSMEEQ
jgi:hypothetical protein